MVARLVQGRHRRGPGPSNARLFESYDFESSETFPNPLPAKAACRALGLPAGPVPAARSARHRPSSTSGPGRCSEPRARRARRCRCAHGRVACLIRSASSSWAASGRSAATARASSSTGRIVVLDCGIMFPEPDMPGIDLVLPGPLVPARTGRRRRSGDPDPRPRGPHRRPRLLAARPVGAGVRLRPHARAWPATGWRRRASRTRRASSR